MMTSYPDICQCVLPHPTNSQIYPLRLSFLKFEIELGAEGRVAFSNL